MFHDDQHGTAVVVLAALLNAAQATGRKLEELKVLVIGLGAAGVAVTKILLQAGVREIVGADSRGALSTLREDYLDGSMNSVKRWYAESTNRSSAPARRPTRSMAPTCSSASPARARCPSRRSPR